MNQSAFPHFIVSPAPPFTLHDLARILLPERWSSTTTALGPPTTTPRRGHGPPSWRPGGAREKKRKGLYTSSQDDKFPFASTSVAPDYLTSNLAVYCDNYLRNVDFNYNIQQLTDKVSRLCFF
jgi:hypothetical protein